MTEMPDDTAAISAFERARRLTRGQAYRRGRSARSRQIHADDLVDEMDAVPLGGPGLGDVGSGARRSSG